MLSGDHELDRYFVLASRGNSNFLFYQQIVAGVYLLFGVSDVAARLVAIGFSLGTVLVAFELGRRRSTPQCRPAGAPLFIALSGYSVLLGRLALLDSTLVFMFTLSHDVLREVAQDGAGRLAVRVRGRVGAARSRRR